MMRWPLRLDMLLRSCSICMTIAVEVSTKPVPATKDMMTGKPRLTPTSVRPAIQTSTCKAPSPKISCRIDHSREGCISRPMMNRNITTPSSAICRMACESEKKPRP